MRTNSSNSRASTTPNPTGVLVVDDHPIVRSGIAELLHRDKTLRVCGKVGNRKKTLEKIAETSPDLVLLDLFLDGVMATDLIKDIREKFPQTRVLVISMQNEAFYAEKSIQAGAIGYVVKEEAPRKIMEAIHLSREGKRYISESVFLKMLHEAARSETETNDEITNKLSEREFQVFQLIGKGLSSREIASFLEVNVKTVETYYLRIKSKLHVKTTRELVRVAALWASNPG